MNSDYEITNDGTIFKIKEDGSISKIARIEDNGLITTLSGAVKTANSGSKGGYWFFIILFAIAAIILGGLYVESEANYSYANQERIEYRHNYENESSTTSSLRSEISSLKQERDNAKSELSNLKSKVSNTYPLIINNIEIANITSDGDILTNYGNSLYGSNTMYLQPRIKYTGLTSGNKTLKIKWYTPDGTISRGTASPSGFSLSESVYVYSGDNHYMTLSGWGNDVKGNWRSGTYRIEIWYENSCLKSKTFTIY